MSEGDLPVAGTVEDTPMSTRQGDEAIGNLLADLISDPGDADDTAQAPDAQDVASPDQGDDDDGFVIDDEGDGLEPDAPEETEFKGGRFASDDAKVKLEDGTTISVAELKRNNLFQKDYSQKTEALSRDRKAIEEKDHQVSELSNALAKQRQVMDALISRHVPKPPNPDLLNTDPMAYMQAQAEFQQRATEHNQWYQSIQQQDQILQQKEAAEAQRRADEGVQQFLDAVPALKAPGKMEAWAKEAAKVSHEAYGIESQVLAQVTDPRFLLVLNDAIRYRKAIAKREQAKAPPAQQQQQRPRIPPQQRMSQTATQRDSTNAFERLRKSGSARDGEAALMKFIT
jgi:hypothetical protein